MILLTGATGFVGRAVLRHLAQAGHQVRCLQHTPARSPEHVGKGLATEVVQGDVTDPASLARAVKDVDAVVHLVAIITEKGQATYSRVNFEGTRSLARAARSAGVRKFIQMSVLGATEDDAFPYLRSKWMGEQAVIESGVPYTILRSSLMFGEGDGFFNLLAGVVKAMPFMPIVGDGRALFQPISVEDVARCIILCLEEDSYLGRTIEIGGPELLTYEELLETVARVLGVRRMKLHIPLPVMRPAVRMMELLLPSPPVTGHQLAMLKVSNATGDPAIVEKTLGFKPKPLAEGLGYIRRISYADALRVFLGFIPRRIRDH